MAYSRLSLNGLVALLSTVTLATLLVPVASAISQGKWIWFAPKGSKGKSLDDLDLYDSSSRGARGSAKLLWRMRGRHLVSLGALLTILAPAFDTFSQQVLGVKFVDVVDSTPGAVAGIPRSEMCLEQHQVPPGIADPPMQAAFFNGLLADTIADVPVHCSTGQCTWPTFPTLGVCGVCNDVTHLLRLWRNITTGLSAGDGSTNEARSPNLSVWSLPSGIRLNTNSSCFAKPGQTCTGIKKTVVANIFVANATLATLYEAADDSAGDNIPSIFEQPWIAPLEFIGVPWPSGWPALDGSNLVATQCNIFSCMEALSLSVTSGRQTQSIIDLSGQTNLVYLLNLPNACTGNPDGSCNDNDFTHIPDHFNLAPGTVFTMNEDDATAMGASIGSSFNQTTGVCGFSFAESALVRRGQVNYQDGFARAMWQGSQDFQAYTDKLTKSKAYTNQSFIHVRWAWIAYPASMLLLGLLFFLASVWKTHDTKTVPCYAWKDSALVLLTISLDEEITHKTKGSLARPGELSERIGKERVFLENNRGLLAMKQQER